MPQTKVVFYCERDGTVPFLEWFDRLSERAQDKCRLKIERLGELGHELRRPDADYLRDGIYELRVRLSRINYRLLYFFHGNLAAVIAHGVIKEQRISPKDIDLAARRKQAFLKFPDRHSHQE